MWKHVSSIAHVGASIAKRSASEHPPVSRLEMSPIGMLIVSLAIIVGFPLLVAVAYTLTSVYPTLAIIEDPSPPAYEPVSLADDVESNANPNKFNSSNSSGPQLLTSSVRSMNRLLRSVGGWKGSFRGFGCFIAIVFANVFMESLLRGVPFVPSMVGSLIADLALVQLHTAWVHIVISQPSHQPFYRRLPPFKKTFEATSLPIFIAWLATMFMIFVPGMAAYLLNLPFWDPSKPNEVPTYQAYHIWIVVLVLVLAISFFVFAVLPAHVVLVRVQASLLPPDVDAIVPFDRSFGGSVDPQVVGGPGYVSWKNAWGTVTRASWVRLYKLFAKVWAINTFLHLVFFVFLGAAIGLTAHAA